MRNHHRSGSRPEQPDEAFVCEHCRQVVPGAALGTEHRNHCPWCLWSLHVDISPGDRRSCCRGTMEPIAVWVRRNGEWAIVHRCTQCGTVWVNRIAGDDNEFALMSLAMRPVARPPFPLDRLKSPGTPDE
ncbi:MAG TPA: RNHCP domain-containing protein [Planctomycetota bacterium]|nr:RNHCP domain-containing protein [Planctomycetota bacterium]